jgi:hypothetical protein
MKRSIVIVCLLVLGFVADIAHWSAAQEPALVFASIGGMKCGAWSDSTTKGPTNESFQDNIYARLQSQCIGHRDDDLNEAASLLVLQTYGRRY